jgi:ferritin-like metal-binding protein YciE
MSLDSLDKLFLEELKDIYNAEKQILRALGYSQAEQLLQQTLEEEEAADQKLTELGESGIN